MTRYKDVYLMGIVRLLYNYSLESLFPTIRLTDRRYLGHSPPGTTSSVAILSPLSSKVRSHISDVDRLNIIVPLYMKCSRVRIITQDLVRPTMKL